MFIEEKWVTTSPDKEKKWKYKAIKRNGYGECFGDNIDFLIHNSKIYCEIDNKGGESK